MNRLVFPAPQLAALRSRLLNTSNERAAFVFAQPVSVNEMGWHLVATEFEVVDDSTYSVQEPDSLQIPPEKIAQLLKRAREDRLSVVLAHTHPWQGPVFPSPADRLGEKELLPTIFRRVPGVPHGRLIFGHKDTHAALFSSPGSEEAMSVREVGSYVTEPPSLASEAVSDAAYDRQVRAFGAEGQLRISKTTVGIVGLGGTGSLVAQSLAHLGVRNFILIDPDVIEQSNLNRVVGSRDVDVGARKVDIARRLILSVRPDANAICMADDITEQEVARTLIATDFLFSCTDSHGSRAVLAQLCYQNFIPLVDLGVRIDVEDGQVRDVVGRVQMLAPGLACIVCTGLLNPELVRRELLSKSERNADKYIVGGGIKQPAVVTINASVAGSATSMFLSAVAHAPFDARNQVFLFRKGVVRPISVTSDPDCPVCSPSGFYGKGDSWPQPGRPASAVGSQE